MNGQINEFIQDPGSITRCKGKEYTNGQMVGCLKECIKMIKSTGKEFLLGKMDENIKGFGLKDSKMVMECSEL